MQKICHVDEDFMTPPASVAFAAVTAESGKVCPAAKRNMELGRKEYPFP
jgi:hypothetical protein